MCDRCGGGLFVVLLNYSKMIKYILFCTLLLVSFLGDAQIYSHDTVINGKTVTTYTYVDQMPSIDYDHNKYLTENLYYPDSARAHNIEGRVLVKFVVNEDGHISECSIPKPVNSYLDEEALRVIGKMPPWKPGKQDGKPVRVYFTAPIVFKLTN